MKSLITKLHTLFSSLMNVILSLEPVEGSNLNVILSLSKDKHSLQNHTQYQIPNTKYQILFTILLLLFTFTAHAQTSGIGYDIATWTAAMNSDGRNDTLSVHGTDLQFTSTAFPNRIDSSAFYLQNTSLASTEIDNLLIRLADNGSVKGYFLAYNTNGYPTSSSSAARTTLGTNNWTLRLNKEPITSISFSNTGQTFTESVLATDLVMTSTPDVSASQVLETWGTLPTGMSQNSSTGTISGTPDAATAGTYYYITRVRATGNYTGYADELVTIVVESAPVTPVRYNINFGSSLTVINTEDPNNKYWNNLLGVSGSVTDIVDEDNNASTIDVTITDAFDAVSDFNGRQPTDGVYPNKAWRSVMDIAAGNGTLSLAQITGSTCDIIIGVSRNATGLRVGTYIVDATGLDLDATLDPPQTITHSGIDISGGSKDVVTTIKLGNIAAHLSFIILIVYP